jgi:hypothetical protein
MGFSKKRKRNKKGFTEIIAALFAGSVRELAADQAGDPAPQTASYRCQELCHSTASSQQGQTCCIVTAIRNIVLHQMELRQKQGGASKGRSGEGRPPADDGCRGGANWKMADAAAALQRVGLSLEAGRV